MIACVNGVLVDEGEASVSVLDYGLSYGFGLFETVFCLNKRIFRFDGHLRRMKAAAEEIMLPFPWSDEEVSAMVSSVLDANGLTDAYVRVSVTRGVGEPGLKFSSDIRPSIIVLARSLPEDIERVRLEGIRLAVSKKHARFSGDVRSRIKSANFLVSALAKLEASSLGVDDVVLLNERGFVSECSTANLFCVVGGVLVTPPVSDGLLAGITRAVVFEASKSLGLGVEERSLSVKEFFAATEVFKTSSVFGVVPVVEVEGVKIGGGRAGEVTRGIQRQYNRVVECECALE